MSDDSDVQINIPKFDSQIPEHLISTLSEKEKWQYEQTSIQGQQNAWLIHRSLKADQRQNSLEQKVAAMDKRIQVFEDLKKIITAKWSLIAGLFAAIGIPAALAAFGAWITHLFEKKP